MPERAQKGSGWHEFCSCRVEAPALVTTLIYFPGRRSGHINMQEEGKVVAD